MKSKTIKKIILFGTGIVSVMLVLFDFIGTFRLCGAHEYGNCMDVVYDIMINLFPIIPLALFSLITYFMRDEIFEAWWKFARIWIPVSMIAILISPSYTSSFLSPIEKGTVTAFTSLVFVVASILIIMYRFYLLKGKKKYSNESLVGIFLVGLIIATILFFTLAHIF